MFQTGYLTIAEEDEVDGYPHYRLRYPNREVRRGLNESLLNALAPLWRSAGDRQPRSSWGVSVAVAELPTSHESRP